MTRILNWLESIIKTVIIVFMLSIVVIITMQMIWRYVLTSPLGWTGELSRYLFIYMSLLAAAIGIRKKVHIGVDFVVERLPQRLEKLLGIFSYLIIIVFMIYLFIYGARLSQETMLQTSPTLGVPMGYMYLVLPLFAVLVVIFCIEQLVDVKGKGV